MELRVIGCHGGETPRHRTSAFVVDGRLALDAGALTSGMVVPDQAALDVCLVSHAHLDHIRDLATLVDNRCQMQCKTLTIAATGATLKSLREHFFNNVLWPDFSKIATEQGGPVVEFVELVAGRRQTLHGFEVEAVPVSHTIDTAGFLVRSNGAAIAYSGDTGPTDELWRVLNAEKDLRALLLEVSFPNEEQGLATVSGHHTPQSLAKDLSKWDARQDAPTLLYHIKPVFQRVVEQQCATLTGSNLEVLALGDCISL